MGKKVNWRFKGIERPRSRMNMIFKSDPAYESDHALYRSRRALLRAASVSLAALVWPRELWADPSVTAHTVDSTGEECSEPNRAMGKYFYKKEYVQIPLPKYEDVKAQLPSPIYDDNPLWVEAYWKAWELAFRNIHEPTPGSGFVSHFIDAAFNENIFLWDSSFMTMFCNFGSPLVPGISTLDNFYARQHDDGEISREIIRATGACHAEWVNRECKPLLSRRGWAREEPTEDRVVTYKDRATPSPNPLFTLDAMNHPILAWAEVESYRVTGNKGRLQGVWEPLVHYYHALQKYLRQGNDLYVTDWASMDNSPRNPYLQGGGTGVDISSEMVLFSRNLSLIAHILGKQKESERYSHEADTLSLVINQRLWDKKRNFYFDLTVDGRHAPVKTIAAFWTLVARVASPKQAQLLVEELKNPNTFGRPNAVPTLAADEPLYDPDGGYWKGSVWAPTTTMVIRGLEAYGYTGLARQIAVQHLNLVAAVYKKTGTIWENYSPEKPEPGKPAKRDFVGWSGIGPILYLLEFGIGLKPDAARDELVWDLRPAGRQGCDRFRFNGHVSSLIAEPFPGRPGRFHITVESDGGFTLKVLRGSASKTFQVTQGRQQFGVE
jgi:Trehalase